MSDKKQDARKKYEAKRVNRSVSFNIETEQDLINYAENLDFSNWVKTIMKGMLEAEKFKKNEKKP